MTDANGAVTDTFAYGPYGEAWGRTGSTTTPFQFNGQYGVTTDPNGLLCMRARFYHPVLRRFLNQDALLGTISPSIALNRYAFANGNPVSLTDPFGLCAEGDFLTKLSWGLANVTSAFNPLVPGNLFQQAGDAMLRGLAAFGEAVDQAPVALSNWLGSPSGMTASDMALALGPAGAAFDEALAGLKGLAALGQGVESTVPVGTQLANGLIAGDGPGAALGSQMMTGDQIALKELVDEATLGARRPLSAEDTQTVMDWAREVNYPGFRATPGDLATPSNWSANPVPHIHLNGIGSGHIPVEWP